MHAKSYQGIHIDRNSNFYTNPALQTRLFTGGVLLLSDIDQQVSMVSIKLQIF